MAFPTTSVLDNFNRANGGLGASWSTDVFSQSLGSFSIVSNEISSGTLQVSNWLNGQTYGPDTEVFVTIASSFDDMDDGEGGWLVDVAGVYMRVVSPGTAGADGYWFYWNGGPNAGYQAVLFRIDNGAYTQLGATYTPAGINAGDVFGASIVGSTLTPYRKPSGGSWAALGTTRTDSTYSAAGYVGVYGNSWNSTVLDDFGGGTVVGDAAPVPSLIVQSSGLRW